MVASTYPSILLQKPKDVSAQELEKTVHDWQTQFKWNLGTGTTLTLCYKERTPSVLLQVLAIPIRSYQFPYVAYLKDFIAYASKNHPSYFFAQPLKLKDQRPEELTTEELAHFLRYKNVIFYTGAGISAAGKVVTMSDLESSLKLNPHNKMQLIKEIFLNPKPVADTFEIFCKSAINGLPTSAHYALYEIAHHRNCCIVTENVDLLQQRTGCLPLHSHCEEITTLHPQDLQKVDAICCIGLSRDDCGWLAHYKAINPKGILIAIDRTLPNYIATNDYFVQGDLQTIVPDLARLLCA